LSKNVLIPERKPEPPECIAFTITSVGGFRKKAKRMMEFAHARAVLTDNLLLVF